MPCWVEAMDDDTAFMELVRANCQGELSPLERGLHALWYADTAQGVSGKGLKKYASDIEGKLDVISKMRSAAEVYQCLVTAKLIALTQQAETAALALTDDAGAVAVASEPPRPFLTDADKVALQGRATHLYEISKADKTLWPVLVRRLIDKEWSVKDTKLWSGTSGGTTSGTGTGTGTGSGAATGSFAAFADIGKSGTSGALVYWFPRSPPAAACASFTLAGPGALSFSLSVVYELTMCYCRTYTQ